MDSRLFTAHTRTMNIGLPCLFGWGGTLRGCYKKHQPKTKCKCIFGYTYHSLTGFSICVRAPSNTNTFATFHIAWLLYLTWCRYINSPVDYILHKLWAGWTTATNGCHSFCAPHLSEDKGNRCATNSSILGAVLLHGKGKCCQEYWYSSATCMHP